MAAGSVIGPPIEFDTAMKAVFEKRLYDIDLSARHNSNPTRSVDDVKVFISFLQKRTDPLVFWNVLKAGMGKDTGCGHDPDFQGFVVLVHLFISRIRNSVMEKPYALRRITRTA
jgi:hypothetical protein